MCAFRGHVNVGFFRGAELPDPARMLEGTGKVMRHVKVGPDRDVDAGALRALVGAAYADISLAVGPSRPLIEVCVESVEAAVAAEAGGAARVELCDNLTDGGTTPRAAEIAAARAQLRIPLHVIVRPRGGDFCYSEVEFDVMKCDVALAKQLGADGVVLGILLPDGRVDVERTRTLIALARPMSVTFHRAFDMTADAFEALDALIDLGVDRILTSGRQPSVVEGLDLITALVRRADGRIVIMACGGVNEDNAARVVAESGVRELHAGPRPVKDPERIAALIRSLET